MRRNQLGFSDGAIILLFLLTMGVIFGALWTGASYFNQWSCARYGELTERSTKYDWWQDTCYVKTQAGWRARSEQRTLDNDLNE